jgi:hypothetical protein
MTNASHAAPRRPWQLWGFSLIIAGIGAYNLWLALDHLRHAATYRALGVSYPPLLRAGCALGWAVIVLALAVGLARRQRWARRWILVILSNYGAFGVLWMVIFARSDFSRGRIAFQAVLTVALLALAAWIIRWRSIRTAFAPPDSSQSNLERDSLYDPE